MTSHTIDAQESASDPQIVELTRDLCQYRCSVVGDANEALFARIGLEVPLTLHRFPSGLTRNGWTVPDNWRVRRALIKQNGRVVFDGLSHALAVAYYSRSFHGEMDLEELKQHLVTHPKLENAHVFHCMWQYRPWQADWAFCMPRRIFETLQPGMYQIDLETTYDPGEMLVGVCDLPGRSDKTIVLNAHTCHPHMANDGLVGVATLIRLVQWLQHRGSHYSYRLVFGPEHLGTVFYLDRLAESDVDRCVAGVFAEMTGTEGPIKVASTFLGDQMIDRSIRHAARHHAGTTVNVPWRCGAGNDETVWEAPGYEIPCVEMTRCIDQFDPFPEYHTCQDTPESLHRPHVNEFFQVMRKAVEVLECNATVKRLFDGLICLSHPDYDLYLERPDPAVDKNLADDAEKWGHLLDSLFRYFDGRVTVLDIAEKHDLPFDRLYRYLVRFQQKGLVKLVRAEVPRHAVTRVSQTREAA